jgi:spermidine synthase
VPQVARGGDGSGAAPLTLTLVGPLLAVGAASLLWQVGAARSVMAGLYGNELTLGLVLGGWLILVGLATALSIRLPFAGRDPRRLLAALLLLLPLGLLASAGIQQALLPAYSAVGQVPGPGRTLLLIVACLLPACLPLGAAFGALSLLTAPSGDGAQARWAARIYLLESVGMAAAGVAFHLWLHRVDLRWLALAASGPAWLLGLWLVAVGSRRRALVLCLPGLLALGYLVPGAPLPLARALEVTVPGYELLERRASRHAALAALRRGDQVLYTANGLLILSNQDHRQVEQELHLSLLAHPRPRRVLMIGGGLGGGLREALKHPVERVDYVELDPELVELVRRWSPELATPLADARVRLLIDDGRRVVARSPRGTYDVILVGLPGPSSAQLNRYYTEAFFGAARRALAEGGVVRVLLEGSETYLSDPLAVVHASVRSGLRRALGSVTALPGGQTLLLARRGGAPDLSPTTLQRRFRQRRLETRTLDAAALAHRAQAFKRQLYRQRLEGVVARRNTDAAPGAYFHAITQWLALTSPCAARWLEALAGQAQGAPWVAPAAGFVLALLLGLLLRRRGGGARGGGAGFAIGLAGLTGMAVELCLVLGLQAARGVVYHELGALLTAFMVGLVLGAPLGRRLVERWPTRALSVTLVACALAALLTRVALSAALPRSGAALPLLLGAVIVLGAAVGGCFPPAVAALARGRGAGAAARAYAWDLTGAAAGALVGALALPVLGLHGTCTTCAALCLGGALSRLRSMGYCGS